MAVLLWWGRGQVGAWPQLAPMTRVLHLAWLIPAAVAAYAGILVASGTRWRHLREPPAAD